MALTNKVGSILRQAITKHINYNGSATMPAVLYAVRNMSSSRLFVGGLSYGMDDMTLRESFTSFGEVIEARIIMDRETGRSRGFGFITFTSGEEASAAMSGMNGRELHGRTIRVDYATERTGGYRGGGGGGYGGGGYGGGGGEVIGVFESLQPSDTDLGSKAPKDVKIQGIWYAQIENSNSNSNTTPVPQIEKPSCPCPCP